MANPGEVRTLGHRLADQHPRVDALVHAAGALSRTYRTNAEGTELTVATQVLGPYLLTAVLAPSLWRASGNIVIVSSGGMYAQQFDLDRLEMKPDGYDGVVAYARAKRAQVVMADAWATSFAPAGVAGYSMHPGWVDTPGLQAGLPRFRALWRPLLREPSEGADTHRLASCRGRPRRGRPRRGRPRRGRRITGRVLPRPAAATSSPVPGAASHPPRRPGCLAGLVRGPDRGGHAPPPRTTGLRAGVIGVDGRR
jgi:NAD(P)-dependent dehydrogenase (short-subunit alcohol dehydrogenase family)